jgi:hypothetical protein
LAEVAVLAITLAVLPPQGHLAAAVPSVPLQRTVWVLLARQVRALPVAMQALAISTDLRVVVVVRVALAVISLGPRVVRVARV